MTRSSRPRRRKTYGLVDEVIKTRKRRRRAADGSRPWHGASIAAPWAAGGVVRQGGSNQSPRLEVTARQRGSVRGNGPVADQLAHATRDPSRLRRPQAKGGDLGGTHR